MNRKLDSAMLGPPTNNTGFGQQQPPTNNTGFGQPQQQPPRTNNTGFGQPPPANNTTSSSGSTANTTRPYNATLTGVSENLKNTNNETAADFAKDILAVHNRERPAVGVPPLVWSDKLATDAKIYAEHLATPGVTTVVGLQHPSAEWVAAHPTVPEGENLAAIDSSDAKIKISAEELQHGWVDEKRGYNAKTNTCTPVPPRTSCGHYMQMVWNTTKEVGCATCISPHNIYLSCRYSPPGNIVGKPPY